jgi:hypothetical protein
MDMSDAPTGADPPEQHGRHQAPDRQRPNRSPVAIVAFVVLVISALSLRVLATSQERSRPKSAATASTAVVGSSVPTGSSFFGNLVRNWSFEQDLSGWKVLGPATGDREPPGRTSGSCAAIRPTGNTPGRIGLALPGVVAAARRGNRYVATAWVRASTPGLQVKLALTETGTAPNGTSLTSAPTLPGFVWRRLSVGHTVAATSTSLDLEVSTTGVPQGEALLVDEVEVRHA